MQKYSQVARVGMQHASCCPVFLDERFSPMLLSYSPPASPKQLPHTSLAFKAGWRAYGPRSSGSLSLVQPNQGAGHSVPRRGRCKARAWCHWPHSFRAVKHPDPRMTQTGRLIACPCLGRQRRQWATTCLFGARCRGRRGVSGRRGGAIGAADTRAAGLPHRSRPRRPPPHTSQK